MTMPQPPNAPDDMASPSDDRADRDAVVALSAEALRLLGQVTARFDSDEHEEWRWIAQHSPDPQIVELLRDSTITALRVVDAIGRLEPVNGATIATQFHIPKGTVSKVTRRLIAQRLATSEPRPGNQKEILFRLTPLGRRLFSFHRRFDEQMERGFSQFLQRYGADDLRVLVRVLRDATEASFLTMGLEAPRRQSGVDDARS